MRLVTLWLVASAETFRVHGASAATHGAKGVQGREAAKGMSKKQQRAATAAKEVCSVGDSPATCRELTAKYRGGGEYGRRTIDFGSPSVSVTHAVFFFSFMSTAKSSHTACACSLHPVCPG